MTELPARLSIIIPVYNVAAMLERCLASVLMQPERDFEVILVDDGSLDDSPSICDDYARADQRVRVIHKVNGGLSSARNAGMEIATGEYLMFLDGDDAIIPGAVSRVYQLLRTVRADVHRISFARCDSTGSTPHRLGIRAGVYSGDRALYELAIRFMMGVEPTYSCMLIVKRASLQGLSFDESVRWMEDAVFLAALFSRVQVVNVTDEVLYEYWFNGESLTRNPAHLEKNIVQSAIVARRVLEELASYPAGDRASNLRVGRRRIELLGRKVASGFAVDPRADRPLLNRVIKALADEGSLAWCATQVGPAVWLNPTAVLTESIRRQRSTLAWVFLRIVVAGLRLRSVVTRSA